VESEERLTAELWVKFGGLRRSKERTRARRSELATVSSLRVLFWRERRGREASSSLNQGIHSAQGVAVDDMRALGADERGHRRRTGAIWRTGGALDIPDGELLSESSDAIWV